jgi:hypothetical protein
MTLVVTVTVTVTGCLFGGSPPGAACDWSPSCLWEGGFGLTAVADTALPVFYHAAAHSLRWICSQDSIMRILQWDLSGKPEELPGSFVQYFLGAERELLEHGCARPNDSSIRPSGATAPLPV